MSSEKSPISVLERALQQFRGELTVADAAARSGLPLRDAEDALRTLTANFAGHLSATSKGELVYAFPDGLVRPKETRLLPRIGRAIAKVAVGAVRLIVRAWVSVVLVGYALVFLAILLALALRGGDDRDSSVGDGLGTVMRVIAEALFWTFHPFSPVYIRSEPRWMHAQARRHKLPFYERVNRFVFGPPKVEADPREQERSILAEIRRQKGRIAPADVVRVTGMSREEAERLLLRLVVDYQGDLTVSESGAILYTFRDLRTTREAARQGATPSPIWQQRVELPPLTGNSAGWNVLFTFINGFNLLASGFVLANGLTLERLTTFIAQTATRDPELAMLPLPVADGVPLVLGAIPFAFSLALFALPMLRLLRRPSEKQRVARQNGWRAVLRQVLASESTMRRVEYTRDELDRAWTAAAGRPATDDEIQDAVQKLGGEVDLRADGTLIYKFDVLAREVEALLMERARATDEEVTVGEVIFSSADEGHGIRDQDDGGRGGGNMARTNTAPPNRPDQADRPDRPAPLRETAPREGGAAGAAGGAGVAEAGSPPVRLLEEQREPIEFIERLLAETSRRRK